MSQNLRGRGWTSSEIAQLRKVAPLGAAFAAGELGRSISSVRNAARRSRISLRQPGERRGLVMGQPRGVRAATDPRLARYRSAAIADPRLEAGVTRTLTLLASGADTCPSCGLRPIATASGWCEPCHLHELALAHRFEIDRIVAQQDADAARQQKHRAAVRVRRRAHRPVVGPS